LDGHGAGPYGHLFQYLTKHPLRFKEHLTEEKHITRFEEAYVGNSKIANWYHYGFGSPQGPIPNKTVNGHYVRQVASYIQYKLGIEDNQELDTLVVFSRKSNRLLINENQLLETLALRYNLKKTFVRMEDHSFEEQVSILKRTKVAIGLHGSILIMAMFLPPGSILIELFPFAVPSDNYTPYRTLCGLDGINIAYRPWENKHEKNNIMYPNRPLYEGGIMHLSDAEQKKIRETYTVPKHICCTDPYWLFRIYQDTIVDINEIAELVDGALGEAKQKKEASKKFSKYYF
jgi:protein O-mannose beta-1,4-N-acetylglucosaminyltransferase